MTTGGISTLFLCLLLTSTVSSWVSSAYPRRKYAGATRLGAAPFINGVAAAGISKEELKSLKQAFVFACQDQLVGYSLDEVIILPEAASRSIPGATGRVLLLVQSNIPDDEVEDLQCAISSEIDEMLYSDPPCLSQPILLSIEKETPPRTDLLRHMNALVTRTVEMYEMAVPLARKEAGPSEQLQQLKPTSTVQVDGAMVVGTSGDAFWDTSSLLVFDDLITDDLRKRLLDVVVGREEFEEEWDGTADGPDPRRWVRGGLMDIPDQEVKPCWGLSDEAVDDLCLHHDAFEEFETILSGLFTNFSVSRLPVAVLGESVSPMTANAPTHGDVFGYHIDGDPMMTPPSPWTDVYGRYPNRQTGKPRFMSCLIYLNDEWSDAWGAPTRFLDVASDTHFDVQPQPGRCVFMDQDITHTVIAPAEAAGQRPRYSLVFKLLLHPKVHDQDMNVLGANWPDSVLVGSANQ